jgi:hypothetical protein
MPSAGSGPISRISRESAEAEPRTCKRRVDFPRWLTAAGWRDPLLTDGHLQKGARSYVASLEDTNAIRFACGLRLISLR